jgi:hypothetical protein
MVSRVSRIRQPKGERGTPSDDALPPVAHAGWRENRRERFRDAHPDVHRGARRGDRRTRVGA